MIHAFALYALRYAGHFCTIPAFFQKALALRRQKQYNNCIFIHRGSERIE
jgi:hypothetical protein